MPCSRRDLIFHFKKRGGRKSSLTTASFLPLLKQIYDQNNWGGTTPNPRYSLIETEENEKENTSDFG